VSQAIQEQVECPSCRASSPFTVWRSLNVTLDPDKKQPLLDGELFLFTCPSCSEKTRIIYPILYHDMQHKLMIWLVPTDESGETHEPPDEGFNVAKFAELGYRLRAARSANELVEKVLIFEAQLDDVAVEITKLAIATQMTPDQRPPEMDIRFSDLSDDPQDPTRQRLLFAIITPGGKQGAAVPRQVYEDMHRAARQFSQGKPPPGQWPHVDAGYVMSLMKIPS
jgi:hypothetical protein